MAGLLRREGEDCGMARSYQCPRCKTVIYAGCEGGGGCCGPAPPVTTIVCRRCGTVLDRPVQMVFLESLDDE
jgi:phage FluMu protein Com